MDLSKFETGLDLEKEFNRIVTLARIYEMDHTEALSLLDEIYDHGVASGKFTKADNKDYMRRKNSHRNGKNRTHLDFALNLSSSQVQEHKVFMYFMEWMRKVNSKKKTWYFNGSDYDGYIMISNFYDSPDGETCAAEPDYKLTMGDKEYFVEAKSFRVPPNFKVANLKKYAGLKKCYLVFMYSNRYYSMGRDGLEKILGMGQGDCWDQKTIIISQEDIDDLVKNNLFLEFSNA